MPYGAGRCFLLADRMALVKQASLGVGLMRKRDQSPPTCVESLIDVVWSRGGAAIVSDGFTSETKSASNCACSFWPWCSETGHVLLSANAEAQRESGNIFSKTHRAQNDTLHFSVQVKSSQPSTINHCHFSFSGTHRHNALSGHIIRYPLKVLWPLFCLSRRLTFSMAQKSTRCQQRSCENLVHINLILLGSFCSFVGRKSMALPTGLTSGECGGHRSTVHSRPSPRNNLEIEWALWHGSFFCRKHLSKDAHTVVIKGRTQSAVTLRQAVALTTCTTCSISIKGHQVGCSKTLHCCYQPEPLTRWNMYLFFF